MFSPNEVIQPPHQSGVVFTNIPGLPSDSSHILSESGDIVGNVAESVSRLRGQVSHIFHYRFELGGNGFDVVDLIPKVGVVGMIILNLTLDDINLIIHLLEEPSVFVSPFSAFTLAVDVEGQVGDEKDTDSEEPPHVVNLTPIHWLSSPPDLAALI